ncbi:DUF1839 family protein [Aliikangiella marina]|uniref:DUF1839 family protein n=1 Tax=Aliikangiella marina TaxID=1712262 RepID=A0A545TBM5_9GAMM|nr:DUF1839 family protein [Aliikangiella marina]TQV74601.1 DUF1839 family protein [Aliikangiella marina]
MKHKILNLSPDSYQANFIHTQERDWAETNCYVDIWIELLHALKKDPRAALSYTLAIDFEGDQWTFFKFPLNDLKDLYGLDVQELAVWRPVVDHVEEQVALGRPVLVELDSFFLPDTVGMAYQLAHVKSTVAVTAIDKQEKRLGYFHGQSYYELSGDDFDKVFHLDRDYDDAILPPYVEIVKIRKGYEPSDSKMLEIVKQQLIGQLNWLPLQNPFTEYQKRLQADLDWLMSEDMQMFHDYSFATLRQLGACYELSTHFIDWLIENGETSLDGIRAEFKSISELAKVYQFQLARAMSRKKQLDLSTIEKMAEHWDKAMSGLKAKYLQ